jgi:hypothetical protein
MKVPLEKADALEKILRQYDIDFSRLNDTNQAEGAPDQLPTVSSGCHPSKGRPQPQ